MSGARDELAAAFAAVTRQARRLAALEALEAVFAVLDPADGEPLLVGDGERFTRAELERAVALIADDGIPALEAIATVLERRGG